MVVTHLQIHLFSVWSTAILDPVDDKRAQNHLLVSDSDDNLFWLLGSTLVADGVYGIRYHHIVMDAVRTINLEGSSRQLERRDLTHL
jgi:hypothetical protein